MAMDEARRDLQDRLEEVLGKEHALTLMAALPPTEGATKADVANLREDMRAMEARLETRLATKAALQELREDMRAMEGRLATKAALEELREDMRAIEARVNERIDLKVESSENRVIAAFRKELVAQTRVFVFSTLTAVVTVGGLAVVAGRVG